VKVIITNILVNRMAGWLKRSSGEYSQEEVYNLKEDGEWALSMGLLSAF
jgi:hypothetical protein